MTITQMLFLWYCLIVIFTACTLLADGLYQEWYA